MHCYYSNLLVINVCFHFFSPKTFKKLNKKSKNIEKEKGVVIQENRRIISDSNYNFKFNMVHLCPVIVPRSTILNRKMVETLLSHKCQF